MSPEGGQGGAGHAWLIRARICFSLGCDAYRNASTAGSFQIDERPKRGIREQVIQFSILLQPSQRKFHASCRRGGGGGRLTFKGAGQGIPIARYQIRPKSLSKIILETVWPWPRVR